MLSFTSRLRAALAVLACGATILALAQTDVAPFDYQGLQDSGKKTLVDKDGSIYVAGNGMATSGHTDFVLVKYVQDSTNHLVEQWHRHYDGPAGIDDTVAGLVIDPSGNVYVAGTSPGSGTGKDIAVVAWTPDGTPLWSAGDHAARFDTGGGVDDIANAMTIDGKGNLIVAGSSGSSIRDGLIVVFRPDGSLKWASHYDAGNDEVFNAVATDGSNIFVAGQTIGLPGNDMLVARYNAGGTIITPVISQDYEAGEDVAKAITYTKNGRIAVAGYVTDSFGTKHSAVYAYDEGVAAPVWSNVFGSASEAAAITYVDNYVYSTGTLHSTLDQFLTEKLQWADGGHSSTWPTSGLGNGIRTLSSTLGGCQSNAIWEQGTNIYVTGYGSLGGVPDPLHSDYLTTRYNKDGTTPSTLFPAFYPGGTHARMDQGFAITDYDAGQIVATGDLYSTVHDYDMGNLLFAQTYLVWNSESYTINTGVYQSGTDYSLEYIDGDYLVVAKGLTLNSNDPPIVVTFNRTMTGPISELSFNITAHAVVGTSQEVQIYNVTTGEWQRLDYRPCTATDKTLYLSVSDDPAHYIDSTGLVQTRVRYFVTGPILGSSWNVSIDQAVFHTIP